MGLYLSFAAVQTVHGQIPQEETETIRAEMTQLRETIGILQTRLDELEQRLAAIETQPQDLYPWQTEQPFYWDGRWMPRDLRLPSAPRQIPANRSRDRGHLR